MTAGGSDWIPRRRVRRVFALAAGLAIAGALGGAWRPPLALLMLPAAAVAAAGLVMLGVRRQLGAGGWRDRIHQAVVTALGLRPDARGRVLDIGCGDAGLLVALLDRASHLSVTGVDYWSEGWDFAQAACEARLAGMGLAGEFRRMDAGRLDFADASFDLVVSVMCFHEVRAPRGSADRGPILAVKEALRVLRPGGRFVLVDRFADPRDYGPPAELQALLAGTRDLRIEPMAKALRMPWPLNSGRAMGPVEMISGYKP